MYNIAVPPELVCREYERKTANLVCNKKNALHLKWNYHFCRPFTSQTTQAFTYQEFCWRRGKMKWNKIKEGRKIKGAYDGCYRAWQNLLHSRSPCVCYAILCQKQLPSVVKEMLTFLILDAFNGVISVSSKTCNKIHPEHFLSWKLSETQMLPLHIFPETLTNSFHRESGLPITPSLPLTAACHSHQHFALQNCCYCATLCFSAH